MPRARARQFFSSGLGFGLETQKPGLGLGLGLETCWTRTRTRVPTHLDSDSDSDSRHADSDSTRTRGNEDSLHLCKRGATIYTGPYTTSHILWYSDWLLNTPSAGSSFISLSDYQRIHMSTTTVPWRLFFGVLVVFITWCTPQSKVNFEEPIVNSLKCCVNYLLMLNK